MLRDEKKFFNQYSILGPMSLKMSIVVSTFPPSDHSSDYSRAKRFEKRKVSNMKRRKGRVELEEPHTGTNTR